jgi:hypothetical protein
MSLVGFKEMKMSEGYVRCLGKAIHRTHQLFAGESPVPDPGKIHAVKSILYAAIERAWLESERLLGVQRMLRELLMLTTAQGDPLPEDREQAMRILDRLASCARPDLKEPISNLKFEISVK